MATGRAAPRDLDRSLQCLVVLTDDWTSSTGMMRSFERNRADDIWKERGTAIPVVVGKKGLGIGRGMVRLKIDGAPAKREGDDKAPAGIFRLSSAFGYAPAQAVRWINLPYLPLSPKIEGIDDPKSRFYNQVVDRSKIARPDWHSSEKMLRDDVRYKWGVVVEHNPGAVPGAGSCIFLHVWLNASTLTTGCTAMSEKDLVNLLRWLDPDRQPVLVQMPRAVYRSLRARHDLPPDPL
jgi:D-alanyl-D-alanine dipeptidase